MSKELTNGLLLVIILASISSCGILRKGGKRDSPEDSKVVLSPVDSAKADQEQRAQSVNEERLRFISSLSPLLDNKIQYNSFSGKAKMHYEGKGQKQEFTSHFRIVKDKAIWVSVTALGGIVQVARVFITPDSFKLINYLEKEVIMMPLVEAGKVLPAPVDFTILQNLIIGNVLRTKGTVTDAADLGNVFSLQVEEPNVVQQVTYNKVDSTLKSLQIRSKGGELMTGLIQYSNYETANARKFPMNRTVHVINGGDQYNLDMNFNNPVFDQPVDLPFSIPKNYKIK